MPYLFDIKRVMKQLQTKKVRPSDASVCQINLPSHPDKKELTPALEALKALPESDRLLARIIHKF